MDCCADSCFLSVRFARSIAAAICRFSSRVSLRLRFSFDNGLNLLVQLFLPLKGSVEIIRAVWTLLGAHKPHLYEVVGELFQRLTVLFVHGQQEEWQHGDDHDECRCTDGQAALENKKQRYADERPAAETDQLPLG